MEHISTKCIAPLHIGAEDTLTITYTDINGVEHKLDSMKFDEPLTVNQVAFFKVGNEYGFKAGIAAMIGEAE